jgi:dipeptidyl aminopeptidase/acylaminoacyl peptidase
MKRQLAFGSWPSELRASAIAAGAGRLSQPQVVGDRVYWLESRPAEGGRQVVMSGRVGEGAEEVSPVAQNVRTRVHEYGGGDYRAGRGALFSIAFVDQRLYRGTEPISEPGRHYADMTCSPDGRWLAAIEEVPQDSGEPQNRLVAFDLNASTQVPRVIAEGHDFFSSPRFSPKGDEVAFIAWDHPDMPWDSTKLYRLTWGPSGAQGSARRVPTASRESVLQPLYSPAGLLTFVSDRSGWWNLYQELDSGPRPLCPRAAEFAQPHWVFGLSNYAFMDAERILCAYQENAVDHLGVLDTQTGALREIQTPFTDINSVSVSGNTAGIVAASSLSSQSVYAMNCESESFECLRSSQGTGWGEEWFSIPEPIEFSTEEGRSAYAFYYPPTHPSVEGPAGHRPPLLVKSHGGPTGRAMSGLDFRVQYWTSRGFAVVDVNYGGSSGFGRAYRERLAGNWGVVDVQDCVNASRWLTAERRVDPERLAITGGSAGGYTTLCALTFHDQFHAGASHYGVGDLEALVRDTHKFESRYMDKLVGPYPAERQLYWDRSPVHHTDRLSCPVIFFQGLEDLVVPPGQAEAMVAALERRGIVHAYVPFEGEQHGFRRAENIVTALDGELYFYSQVFGFEVERRPGAVRIVK